MKIYNAIAGVGVVAKLMDKGEADIIDYFRDTLTEQGFNLEKKIEVRRGVNYFGWQFLQKE
jgi:hypothetical protein